MSRLNDQLEIARGLALALVCPSSLLHIRILRFVCKIIEVGYHAYPKNWRRIDCSFYHPFSFLNAASSVALLINALSSVAFLIRQIQN
jgi:hypothetical protein